MPSTTLVFRVQVLWATLPLPQEEQSYLQVVLIILVYLYVAKVPQRNQGVPIRNILLRLVDGV